MTKATAAWTPRRQPSLLLLSLALLTMASLAPAQAPSPKAIAIRYDSIWHLLLNRPELAPLAMTISQFPDLLLLLSDPNLEVTMFLPRDVSFSTMQTAIAARASRAAAIYGVLTNSDLLFPPIQTSGSAAFMRRLGWATLMDHALLQPRAQRIDALAPGQYTTALTLDGGTWTLNVTRNGTNTYVRTDVTPLRKVVTPDLQAGKSMVHIIEGALSPRLGIPGAFASIADAAPSGFAAIMRAATQNFDADASAVPLTALLPSDAALAAWLRARNTSLAVLQDDSPLCARLVMAHVVPSAGSPALFANDLLGLAAAVQYNITNLDGSRFLSGPSARANLLGGVLQVRAAPYSGISPGPLQVGFASRDGRRMLGPWGRVYSVGSPGGAEAGGSDVGSPISTVHYVDRVLM